MLSELVRRVLWPPGVHVKVSLVLGALSLLALAQHALEFGLGGTLQLLLDYYDRFLEVLLGWAEPYLQRFLEHLRSYVPWDMTLHPHWRHILVLMSIYFVRDARGDWEEGWPVTSVFNVTVGLTIALAASVAAGVITPGPLGSSFLIVAIPVAGLFLYDLIYMVWAATFLRADFAQDFRVPTPTWWGDIKDGLPWLLGRTLGGLAILWLGLQLPFVRDSASPGLLMLSCLILVLALYWMWEATFSVSGLRRDGESWRSAYWRTGTASLGAAMAGVYVWLAILLLCNAGLQNFDL